MKNRSRWSTTKLTACFKKMGPGLITGASDDDPSGIATYSQAGAQFGLMTLWTALFTFPLMLTIQEMSGRIGLITGEGLACNIKKHYPRPILWILILFSFPAIILNIGADIASMGAVANLVIPAVSSTVFSILFTCTLTLALVFLSYRKIVFILKYLCLSLLLYLIIPFLSKPDWWQVFKHTLIPTIQLNKEYMSIIVAILGTTISPYLFFWQATMEAEDIRRHKNIVINRKVINYMDKDVGFGMFSSNLVMYFIILTTGTVLFQGGVRHIETVEQAAKALEPLAGNLSYLLFALGIIGTGVLSIPVLCGCLSYIISSTFDWGGGLDKRLYQAKRFYFVMVISLLLGLTINFTGLSPIKALLYTAVLYGLTAPVLILIILHICNNKKIMGKFTNTTLSNSLGVVTFLTMVISGVLLIYFLLFHTVH
jgi:NRAMP (natural resistance-associated macrophage protein)-like metal ion transporter